MGLCFSSVVNVFAVGLHSLSTSPDTISWLSDFLFYNAASLFIEPHLLKRQTNAARNTGLPLQLLLHPPFHCCCCTLAERAGSSPHGGVWIINLSKLDFSSLFDYLGLNLSVYSGFTYSLFMQDGPQWKQNKEQGNEEEITGWHVWRHKVLPYLLRVFQPTLVLNKILWKD